MVEDLRSKDTWMVFKIMGEFVEGFETLGPVGPAISIFGGSRIEAGHPYYATAEAMARTLVQKGFAIITGGGPGAMEAANRGAQEAGGHSIGLNIKIPMEQRPNEFIDTLINFDFFFARKVMFVKYAVGYVVLPGGYGTLDELFEALTLIQTDKLESFPVVLIGREYWSGLMDWLRKTVLAQGMIAAEDLDIFMVTDDPQEAAEYIAKTYRRGLREKERAATERARRLGQFKHLFQRGKQ